MATFISGNPLMVDHTPGSDVTAGDVIVTNDTPRIAHRDIASGELGALAAGGGVYQMTADAAIAADTLVYWNAAASKVTETASTHKIFGRTVQASSADGDLIEVIHQPELNP